MCVLLWETLAGSIKFIYGGKSLDVRDGLFEVEILPLELATIQNGTDCHGRNQNTSFLRERQYYFLWNSVTRESPNIKINYFFSYV